MEGTGKLVRDRVPELITAKGDVPRTRVAQGEEYLALLRLKLLEEVQEFLDSDDADELVDVIEVVYALARHKGVEPQRLEELREAKELERGGFRTRTVLISTSDNSVRAAAVRQPEATEPPSPPPPPPTMRSEVAGTALPAPSPAPAASQSAVPPAAPPPPPTPAAQPRSKVPPSPVVAVPDAVAVPERTGVPEPTPVAEPSPPDVPVTSLFFKPPRPSGTAPVSGTVYRSGSVGARNSSQGVNGTAS